MCKTIKRRKPRIRRLTLLLSLLFLTTALCFSQKSFTNQKQASDSIAVACDSNWCGNVYNLSTYNSHAYIYLHNLGSAGDLAISMDADTAAIVGAFGGWVRVEPGRERIMTLYGKVIRIRAIRKGTTVPFELSMTRIYP
jgi:hypothetical protein